ncbi:hypothetical protein J6590_009354 [Homalodisca vitripennis]|nr:hypothetical protein J6590_009354 [Homalodisca vitripennis]
MVRASEEVVEGLVRVGVGRCARRYTGDQLTAVLCQVYSSLLRELTTPTPPPYRGQSVPSVLTPPPANCRPPQTPCVMNLSYGVIRVVEKSRTIYLLSPTSPLNTRDNTPDTPQTPSVRDRGSNVRHLHPRIATKGVSAGLSRSIDYPRCSKIDYCY